MNLTELFGGVGPALVSVLVLASVVLAAPPAGAQESGDPAPEPAPAEQPASEAAAAPAEPPCAAPEFRQLDFWVGEWDLTWEGGSGTNSIQRRLDDCVIEERFSGDMGGGQVFDGHSLSTYDRQAGVWKQTWVDNQGGYLDFTGGKDGDRFVLERETVRDGKPTRQRMVFYNIEADSLDWNWEQSVEGGPWELRWKIHYQRRR